jgi:glutaconate CoA-transferase, subunit A
MTFAFSTVEALAAEVPDGAVVAVMKEASGAPMALARALARRRARNLHYLCVPTGGLVADLLIGAGCVATVEGGGVSLGERGQAPSFGRAVREGAVRPLDTTCPAVYAAIQAGEKGVPFLPIRGLIGSDILRHRSDYKIVDNPFQAGDPLVLVPAIRPDAALIHAPLADRRGNVWVGRQHELKALAHAARRALVTVEAVHEGDLAADPVYSAGTISALYVSAVAHAPKGAWPLGLAGYYGDDEDGIADYLRAAAIPGGVQAWVDARAGTPRRAAAE